MKFLRLFFSLFITSVILLTFFPCINNKHTQKSFNKVQTNSTGSSFYDFDDISRHFNATQKFKQFTGDSGEDKMLFLAFAKKTFLNTKINMIIPGNVIITNVDENHKPTPQMYTKSSTFSHALETWKDLLIDYLYFEQKNIKPFIVNEMPIKIKCTNVLSDNQWFTGINARIIYSKTGQSRDIFNSCEELGLYVNKYLFEINWKTNIYSIPYISLSGCPSGNFYIRWLDFSELAQCIPMFGFNIDNMWKFRNIDENTEEIYLSQEFKQKSKEATYFIDKIKKHAKFTVFYSTENINETNNTKNYSFNFSFNNEEQYRFPINNGSFKPLYVVLNQDNEENLFIQQAVQEF